MCYEPQTPGDGGDQEDASSPGPRDSILVAVPGRDDKKIEVYRFPDEKLLHIVPKVQITDTGEFESLPLLSLE
jgi:hypothetical protein